MILLYIRHVVNNELEIVYLHGYILRIIHIEANTLMQIYFINPITALYDVGIIINCNIAHPRARNRYADTYMVTLNAEPSFRKYSKEKY